MYEVVRDTVGYRLHRIQCGVGSGEPTTKKSYPSVVSQPEISLHALKKKINADKPRCCLNFYDQSSLKKMEVLC